MTTTLPSPTGTTTPEEAAEGTRGAWLVVMKREIVVRALNKTFLVGLLVSVVIIAALAAFMAWQGSKTDSFTVAVPAGDTAATAAVESAASIPEAQGGGAELTTLEVPDDAAARTALAAGDADAWLHPAAGSADDGWVLTGEADPDSTLTRLLTAGVAEQTLATNAEAAGTTTAELTAGGTLTTDRLDGDAVDSQTLFFASFALALLFFLGALGSGQMIAGSVVEEKQSRLVEIMATAVPLRHLLAGKILGSSVVALAQNVVFAAVGLVALSFTPTASILPSLSTSLLWFVLFFAVGFLGLAALYAVAGALASRTEDLQHTTTPMTMAVMGVYFLTFSASGTFETVLSYVPVASVVSMPVRVLSGDAAWWEPIVSLLILAAFAVVALLVSERAYRGALLQTGGRIGWRSALTARA
ncbi:ABC transporter permease [Krasilnikoviella flava]|uniref:ABC-2 type transport system permease protein n=1 Tax=Krasilnikoviella flava TaxID=526729 RepID=A0A1T5K218_9MICO|nr:ABC transporter permease [Krasilnikoviella flava]SKC57673.1 ABC-2 type transport system permease protein [Krasilnikoviella flava]